MTRFNPDADKYPIEQWEGIAEEKAAESGAAWRILGGILAGGAGLALSFEILGIVAGGYLFYSAYDRLKNSGKNLKAVRDFGCLAHLLNEQDFRSFSKQFGDKEIYDQLTFAEDRGFELSKHAQNWLDCSNPPKQLMGDRKHARELERQLSASTNKDTQKKINTQTEVWSDRTSTVDIVGSLTNSVSNLFIVGLGGSGKGMLTANLLRALKHKHPSKKIFLINGKDDPKEAGYFAGIVDIEKKLHCESAKPGTVAAWFEAAIAEYDDFAVKNNGALLVIDEGTIIGARLKTAKSTALSDKLIGTTSCGGSTGKNIWFIAQTPYVGANGSDLSGISQLTPIAIVSEKNLSVLDTWKKAALFKKFDTDEIADLVNKSECDRAVYFGKDTKWYSMPVLENYSSFNRDTGEAIGDIPVEEEKTDLEKIEDSFKASNYNLSNDAQKILDWLQKQDSNEWYYFRKSGDIERHEGFRKMISRLDCDNPLDIFQELFKSELVDVSGDGFGVRII